MKKIAVVTDSTACLNEELLKEHHIYVSYLAIVFGRDAYEEFRELSPAKFLELSAAQKELPTTSQPAVGATVALYEKILSEGYDEIIHLTLSSALSGTYGAAVSAAAMVDEKNIHVFDTKAYAYIQGALAIEAAKMAKAGESIQDIKDCLVSLMKDMAFVTAIKDLTNLKKGGRISKFSASLGSALQVKPIIGRNAEGGLEPLAKIRTFKKAINFLVEEAKKAGLNPEVDEIGILHMDNPEAAARLKEEVLAIYPGIAIVELPLSLVLAIHAGPGAAAIGWLKR